MAGDDIEGSGAGAKGTALEAAVARAEEELRTSNAMLQALTRVQSRFILSGNPRASFEVLLAEILRLTESAYGFIGEVLTDEREQPYLKTHAITNIAWSPETRDFFEANATKGLEFRRVDTLFGAVITTQSAVIANAPAQDLRRGGLPPGHPPLNAFLGLPFTREGRLIGMVGLANRPSGYDEALVERLAPFLATCTALTEAFRSERSRREALEALEAAQARLGAALDAGGIGLWTWHPLENRVVWDSSAEDLFGRSLPTDPEDALRALVAVTHPEDQARLQTALQATVAEGADLDLEFRVLRSDGRVLWVAAKGRMERDAEGRSIRMANAAMDITERKVLEEQLRESQKMEAIGQLAGGVAHDFNNLLTVIEMHVSLLKMDPRVGGELQEWVGAIADATRSAANLTRQLLTFSRRQPVRLRPVALNEVVEGVGAMLARILGEDVNLEIEAGVDLPAVQADPGLLEQVLLNLAVNARDAMPAGGRLRIETSFVQLPNRQGSAGKQRAHGPCVRLTVEDTGCGIPPEHLERIFEPFFTTKDVGKGTGLGLATAYGIIKQHRGWIEVHSEVGQGTRFEILLRATSAGKRPQASPVPETPAAGRGERILVVEDQAQLRVLVSGTLRRFGYDVIEAESGHEALEKWENIKGEVDLLLTDLVMPGGLSGRDVAARLRQEKPGLKVIYTSGYSAEVPLGAEDPFLQKPYASSVLVRLVRSCLDGLAS